jgi:ApbE superfamily uncharacterized protein (UPF0280 family)
MAYEPRTYREQVDATGLVGFEVVYAETDLHVSATRDLSAETDALVRELREELATYIAANPRFAESHVPIAASSGAPAIAKAMAQAAETAGVGPMAAVAGAFAEAVARALEPMSPEVIVENGGDSYLIGTRDRTVLLGAGDSPLSERVAIIVTGDMMPVAVCTSSGRVGPSLSYGNAHAVTVLAESGALADAAASSIGNLVHGPDDVEKALARAREIPGVTGALVIVDDRIGAVGRVRLAPAPQG